jgi:hypothetical protein
MISFPQAPEHPIRVVSIFFQNSQRFSQLKLHHQWQMEKSSIKNVLIILLGHLWVAELTYR